MSIIFKGDKHEIVYSAELTSVAFGNECAVLSGCLVSPKTPESMAVEVEGGKVFFDQTEIIVAENTNLAINANGTSYLRLDLILVSKNTSLITVLEGTPDPVPATPDYDPTLFVPLAIVKVDNTTTSITSDNLKDIRTINTGGAGGGGAGGTISRARKIFTNETVVNFIHNLGDDSPLIGAYDLNGNAIPFTPKIISTNEVELTFDSSRTGYAVVQGGVGTNNGYYKILEASVTGGVIVDIAHNLEQKFVNIVAYDSTGVEITAIDSIKCVDDNNAQITFTGAHTDVTIVVTGGVASLEALNLFKGTRLRTASFNVTDVKSQILAEDVNRLNTILFNNSDTVIYVGGTTNTLTAVNGYEIEPFESIVYEGTGVIEAIKDGSTPKNLRLIEVLK